MIDSLAQGAGWQLGKAEFWTVMKGAPFLLAWNPNITPTPRPCYYECITFDEDVPIYGPAAQHPMFEFDEDPFNTWLNTDHADWWSKDPNLPPPRATGSFLENVYGNAHTDAQRYSAGVSTAGAHGAEGLIRFAFNALMDPGGTASKVVEQVAAGLQELPEQVVRVINDPTPVVEGLWQALQTPEGAGELVFEAEALLASLAVKLPLPRGFKLPLRLPARATLPARSLVGSTEAVCRKPLGNALDWTAHVGARTQAKLRNTLTDLRDRLANQVVAEGIVDARGAARLTAPDSGVMRERILGNLENSRVARESSRFELHLSRESQIYEPYGGVDPWARGTLRRGSIVYGGVPGQTRFYFDFATARASNLGSESLWKSLQVAPSPTYGYRMQIQAYRVLEDIDIPVGPTVNNPQLGPGGGFQYYIRDFESLLQPIRTFDLH
jgi:hypothetical protein